MTSKLACDTLIENLHPIYLGIESVSGKFQNCWSGCSGGEVGILCILITANDPNAQKLAPHPL